LLNYIRDISLERIYGMANFDLANTLQINGETYNINAVQAKHATDADTAKKAKQLEHVLSLIINTFSDTAEKIYYDGSEDYKVSLVPASGGKFTGPLRVPNVEGTINKTGDVIEPEAVLNYSDIANTVLTEFINKSTIYNWDGEELLPQITGGTINGISIVVGNRANLESFVNANNRKTKNHILAFLYISLDADADNTEDNAIYYGTYDSTATRLAGSAANKLIKPRELSVSLASTAAVKFDGTKDVTLGITGKLPVANGGTGAGSAEEAIKNLGVAAASHTHKYAASSEVNGAAIKAVCDNDGHEITKYYQPRILTGTVDPSKSTVAAVKNAADGAIYIKYTT
jgi:hypothetical protein